MAATCPICQQPAQDSGDHLPKATLWFDCRRCGIYDITMEATNWLKKLTDRSLLPFLSAYTRQATRAGGRAMLDSNWKSLAEAHRHTPVQRKLERVLEYLGEQSSRPGSKVKVEADDFPIFDAEDSGEIGYLVEALVKQGSIEPLPAGGYHRLTPDGWRRLAPADPGGEAGTCFVAMAFSDSLVEAFDVGIAPAVLACGLRPIRVDRVQHNGIVTDLILAGIRRAQVTIADVTLQRTGVYFEAGFALGLGRTVIWTCRKDEIEKVHFDTRQYSHVVWTSPVELREKLEARIKATVPISVKN